MLILFAFKKLIGLISCVKIDVFLCEPNLTRTVMVMLSQVVDYFMSFSLEILFQLFVSDAANGISALDLI